MSFTAPKFTNAGRQLQTRVIAGDTLTFTAIKLGDGTMTTEPIAALTDLIHGIITLPVHEVRRNADYAEVTGVFQNAGLSSGFYWREIGIFAADPDYPNDRSHDILYCYQNAAELAEYIPSASSAVIEKIIRVACVVGDAENVTVGLASQAYAKAEDLQALEEQHSKDVERINNALDAVDPTKITTKAAPADGDGVMIADSADGGKAKRLLWSNVKAALGKLFVPLARTVNGKALAKDVTLTGDDIAMGADDAESLRAAMAKRAMNHSEAIPQNDCDFITNVGVYRGYNDTKNMNNDDIGTIVVSLPWDYNSRQQIVFVAGGKHIFHRAKTPASWGEYTEIAQCVAPEVHELPLAAGWTKFDATCRYYKTQESIVIVSIAARTTQSFRESAALATLPEGFRPAADLEVPAIFKGSRRLVTIKATADGNLFVDLTDQSGVAITSDDYFFATFAFMS